jgi:hypothetical protein
MRSLCGGGGGVARPVCRVWCARFVSGWHFLCLCGSCSCGRCCCRINEVFAIQLPHFTWDEDALRVQLFSSKCDATGLNQHFVYLYVGAAWPVFSTAVSVAACGRVLLLRCSNRLRRLVSLMRRFCNHENVGHDLFSVHWPSTCNCIRKCCRRRSGCSCRESAPTPTGGPSLPT